MNSRMRNPWLWVAVVMVVASLIWTAVLNSQADHSLGPVQQHVVRLAKPPPGPDIMAVSYTMSPFPDPAPGTLQRLARRFRHHKIGHLNRPVRRVFKHPRRDQRKILAAVRNYYLNHPYDPNTYFITAKQRVRYAMKHDNCVGTQNYNPYGMGFNVCRMHGKPTSRHDIQRVGSVVLCGLGVAIGATQPEAAPPLMVVMGGLGCAWGMWSAFDPG